MANAATRNDQSPQTFSATISSTFGSPTGTVTFTYGSTTLCNAVTLVGGGATCAYSALPVGSDFVTASYSGNSNFSGSSASLTQIVGVLPAVTLSPTGLIFPTQIVFTSSKAQTVTLTNSGVGTLSITNIAAKGAFTQTNNCGSTVNSGGSCTLNVTFKPAKSGSITGSLSITDNAPLSPQTVSLKGTETYIQFNPVSFNFGNQPVGTKSLAKKITLSNKGSVPISITKISLTGTNGTNFAETNTCGSRVAAGASCFITVTFTPSAKGRRTANVSVTDNGGKSPQSVVLSGTGT